jgi:hypothetical protein
MDRAVKEAKWMKQRVEILERENFALKKSVYDLSARLSMLSASKSAQPLVLEPQPLDLNGNLAVEMPTAWGLQSGNGATSPLDGPLGMAMYHHWSFIIITTRLGC